MLADFIALHRGELIARAEASRSSESSTSPSDGSILDHLQSCIRASARDGEHDDIHQAIVELAGELHAPISSSDQRALARCLDAAVASPVTDESQRERAMAAQGNERLGELAREMRGQLNLALTSFEAIRSGHVSASGSTGAQHQRSLMGLLEVIERSLADVRLAAGIARLESIAVQELVFDVVVSASVHAREHQLGFMVTAVTPALTIEGDREMLAAGLWNLLHHAFKHSPKHGQVSLTTRATAARVLFLVEYQCGGLAQDRGLAISHEAALASGGELRVHDIPGKGCVLTLDLPRTAPHPPTLVDAAG